MHPPSDRPTQGRRVPTGIRNGPGSPTQGARGGRNWQPHTRPQGRKTGHPVDAPTRNENLGPPRLDPLEAEDRQLSHNAGRRLAAKRGAQPTQPIGFATHPPDCLGTTGSEWWRIYPLHFGITIRLPTRRLRATRDSVSPPMGRPRRKAEVRIRKTNSGYPENGNHTRPRRKA